MPAGSSACWLKKGQRVQAGELLAELDPVRYEAAVAQAEAQVAAQNEVLAGWWQAVGPRKLRPQGPR